VHTLRVVLVVISIPVIFHLADTVQPPVQIADGASYAALLACLGVGAVISFVSSRLDVLNPWILMLMVADLVHVPKITVGALASGLALIAIRPTPPRRFC
jgi:uncharacterized membrane protein AbrB (regulator of aidB expression)